MIILRRKVWSKTGEILNCLCKNNYRGMPMEHSIHRRHPRYYALQLAF